MAIYFSLKTLDLIPVIDLDQFDDQNAPDCAMCHIEVHREERERARRVSAIILIFISMKHSKCHPHIHHEEIKKSA